MSIEEQNLDAAILKRWQKSPLLFIREIWGLTPQPVKDEYKNEVNIYIKNGQWDKVEAKHFGKFVKGKNITWQQWLIVIAVERAMIYGNNKISVVAGHGIGKDMICSLLIIWYLFCHYQAQVGATAPTSEQLNDILWKEISIWMGKMPGQLKDLFEWQSGYIRVKEEPEKWFARARTARKEAPEAIAGLHGDHVLIIGDEASGIPDEIYRSAEGSMTGPNVLVILIGNGIRNTGYFYDTHHTDKANWQTFSFSSEESPVVEEGYIERMESKFGRESDEFKIRVAGGFPRIEGMDDQGLMPLLASDQIVLAEPQNWVGKKVMAVDPSGEGDDMTVWVVRDNFQARVVATETTSSEKTIALKTLDLIRELGIDPGDVVIDNFGVGANVAKELLLLDHTANVNAMNWGQDADDDDLYLNMRAQCCFRAKEWFLRGGVVSGDELKRDLLGYYYQNTLSGKKKIQDKPKMRKRLGRSPDRGDAMLMTFVGGIDLRGSSYNPVNTQTTKKDIYGAI